MKRRYLSQPRIPGMTRVGSHDALPPFVDEALRHKAEVEGVSYSWLKSQIICDWCGVNSRTAELYNHERFARRVGKNGSKSTRTDRSGNVDRSGRG